MESVCCLIDLKFSCRAGGNIQLYKGQSFFSVYMLGSNLPLQILHTGDTNHLSGVTGHFSPGTCHQRQQPQPWTLPMLTPPECTAWWCCFGPRPKNAVAIFYHFWRKKLFFVKPMSFHYFPYSIFWKLLILLWLLQIGENNAN